MKKIYFLFAFFAFYCQARAQAPTNDNCANATPLTVNSDFSCASKTSGTLVGATNSGVATTTGTADDDVWYTFVATAAIHKISLTNIVGDNRDLVHEILSGNCGQLNVLSSRDPETSFISGLTVGTTYYVRVFSYTSTAVSTTFDICIGTPTVLASDNDECSTAISLTVNTSLSCTAITTGILVDATNSGIATTTGTADDDVWYSFVATATSHRISLLNIEGNTTDLVHEVFENTCNTLAVLSSSDPESSVVSGLTVGTTYYVRVFSYGTNPAMTSFDICIATMPELTNDECDNAISLTVNTDSSCTSVTAGTLVGATNSGIGTSTGTADDDVWYSFVATATSHRIRLVDSSGDLTDLVHEVMEGSCGQLRVLTSSDPDSSLVTGLTLGTTYYVRVFSYVSRAPRSTIFNICITIPPAAPTNDDCFQAVAVPVNTDTSCTLRTAGTLVSATDSQEGDNDTGTPDDDVWYTFVATATTHQIKLLNVQGDVTDLVHEVLQGNCGGQLGSISISDPDSSQVSGLTVGATYYVRVFTFNPIASESTTFELCISIPPTPPANDECTGAIALTVNTDSNCTTTTAGALVGATDSAVTSTIGLANDDVWYSFIATATSHKIKLLNTRGDQTDLVHEVFEGNCGQLASIAINDSDSSLVSGLTVGTRYYIRVFTYRSEMPESTTFDICISATPLAPANDECANAVVLTINSGGNCATTTSGTLVSATNSGTTSTEGTADDDVWYSFVATATTHRIKMLNVQGDVTDVVHEVLQGSCGQLTSLSISDPDSSVVSGLTIGTTYYVRVFTFGTVPSESTTFDICIGAPPPPPANDDCINAISLIPATTYAGGAINSTIDGATDSATTSIIPAPGCASYSGGDVWYKTVIPADGKLTVETGNPIGSSDISFDSGLAVYSGPCDNLQLIECSDDGEGVSGNYSRINLTGRIAGETVYIRVWEYSNDEEELFSISAWSPTLGVSTFNELNFKAYPNPVNNVLNLSYGQNISDVQIYNLLGQNMASKSINNTSAPIDMSGLPSGSYLVKVTAEGQSKTIKVIKQ